MSSSDLFGMARVREPVGRLPQAAIRLDPDAPVGGSEIRIDVEYLNLDSASFRDLTEHAGGDPALVRAEVARIGRDFIKDIGAGMDDESHHHEEGGEEMESTV